MKKITPVVSEFIDDPEMIELAKKPDIFCKHYNIPVNVVEGVKLVKDGGKVLFEYLGKSYKNVEAIARDWYESKGFEVSWCEGVPITFLNYACGRALVSRVLDNFVSKSYESYVRDRGYEAVSPMLETKIRKELKERDRILKEAGVEAHKQVVQKISNLFEGVELESSSYALKYDVETTKYNILRVREALISQPPDSEEIKTYILEFVEEQRERYLAKNMKYMVYRYNDWSINFALRMYSVMGVSPFIGAPIKKDKLPMYMSDLTVLDAANKKLMFVEVKNQDQFTERQLMGLKSWLSLPEENRESFELCLVQPQQI